VTWCADNSKWKAQALDNGRQVYLGLFDSQVRWAWLHFVCAGQWADLGLWADVFGEGAHFGAVQWGTKTGLGLVAQRKAGDGMGGCGGALNGVCGGAGVPGPPWLAGVALVGVRACSCGVCAPVPGGRKNKGRWPRFVRQVLTMLTIAATTPLA